MELLSKVILSRFAEKQLRRLPKNIKESLWYWVETVERMGLREVRKFSGYHDEPLKGMREGQRSIRLNKAYRAIYTETENGIEIIVIEVSKHEY